MTVPIHIDLTNRVIEVDGEDIANRISGFALSSAADDMTILTVQYVCYDDVDVRGNATVVHACPLREGEDA